MARQSNIFQDANDAYSVYDAGQGLYNLFGTSSNAGANAVPTWMNQAYGQTPTATAGMNPLNVGAGAGGGTFQGLGDAFNTTAGGAGAGLLNMAAILGMGAFGFPSGKANIEHINETRKNKILEPILEKIQAQTPAGMTQEEYNMSRQPPKTPWAVEEASIRASGVGDVDNEVEAARMAWERNNGSTDSAWQAQGDNSLWYNPDMTRTDYAGEFAPGLTDQRQTAVDTFGANNVRDPYSGLFGGSISTPAAPDLPSQGGQGRSSLMGNIYGEGVPRQTFNGQDLYADQTLQQPTIYRGYK